MRRELFYNINYFSVVALGAIFFAVLLLIPSPLGSARDMGVRLSAETAGALQMGERAGNLIAKFALFLTALEGAFTFFRLLGRASFLLSREMRPN